VERGHELALGVAPAFSGLRFVAYALPQRAAPAEARAGDHLGNARRPRTAAQPASPVR
jgi:hypothetical protein